MGSPVTEKGRLKDEGPQRRVTISNPFYMGLTEVTQTQYQCVTGKNPSEFRGPKLPVERVSWDEAMAFCTALSKKTGRTVRLPTEAQWEYACRAGTKTRFSFGNENKDMASYGWSGDNSGKTTHPVGRKKPNPAGLYDMHGNVWEWCSDRYQDGYKGLGLLNPKGPKTGSTRVYRGGAWAFGPDACRAANRAMGSSDRRQRNHGFRVVVDTAPLKK